MVEPPNSRGGTAAPRSKIRYCFQPSYDRAVNLTLETEREDDGRWIAEAVELPGVMCYGSTRTEAVGSVERMAVETIEDRIAHGELAPSALEISFTILDEQLASN